MVLRMKLKKRLKKEQDEKEDRMNKSLCEIEKYSKSLEKYSAEWHAVNRLMDFYFCNWRAITWTINFTYMESIEKLKEKAKKILRRKLRKEKKSAFFVKKNLKKCVKMDTRSAQSE